MLYLVMDEERMEVASAYLSDNQVVTGFDVNENKIIQLEGVNFENVFLEDEKGQRVEFLKKQASNTNEIEEMRYLIKSLNEKVKQLEEKDKEVEHAESAV